MYVIVRDLQCEFEHELVVSHIQNMEAALFGLTTTDVRKSAYQLADKKRKFNKSDKMAGVHWRRSFL